MDRLISEKAVLEAFREYQGSISDFYKAIKAIPSAEPCDDCVSRANLISKLEILDRRYGSDFYWETRKIVDKLPSVKPQEKTGHWKLQPSNKEQGERDFIWWKCSKCGQVIFSETEKDRREYHAFCGRCGAKMVEPQESEE